MKWICGFVFGLLLAVSSFAFAGSFNNWKAGSEPEGFKSIAWGTDIKTLAGMEYFDTELDYGGIQKYKKKGDNLRMGSVILDKIIYAFWGGKFCGVEVYVEGYSNWDSLKDAVFMEYGKGFQSNDYAESYICWFGERTWMGMAYSESAGKGKLNLASKKIIDQQEAYDVQRARKGAKKGF